MELSDLYTHKDLEAARDELRDWKKRWENYSGNNPNKYQSELRSAREKVRRIESYLKCIGEIPLTPQEELERILDREFPDASSNQVVSFEGKKYQRKFWPLEKNRPGKSVTSWGQGWRDVKE